ncbi:MAG: 50S ribosomal protein L16 [Candidatus Niyogibacteria bacterium]|nr:MAG: 50S ribosomal protein L16 [Candidatus Niyogibacteria bacterium]
MLLPKKVKHRKWHRLRGSERGVDNRGTEVSFGSFGLKSQEGGHITAQQIEAGRKAISRYVQKGGRMWIRIFPDRPKTAKPPEVGMGAGKGDLVGYFAMVKAGRVIFEVDGLSDENAHESLRKAGAKLGLKTKIVKR